MAKQRIGIDIGKVIIGGGDDNADTSFFSDNFLSTPIMTDAFESVTFLAERFDVFLISKCGPRVQEKTLRWLDHHQFTEKTGIPLERITFCRKRPQKAGIAKKLELVAFIDDREDIIESLQGVVQHPILFENWTQTMSDLKIAGLI